jgi:hypothetical protein
MGGISISIFFKFAGIHNARSDGLDPTLSQSDFSRPAFRRSSVLPAFIGLFIVVVFLRHIYIALQSLNERQSFSYSVFFSWVFEGNTWDLKLNIGPRPS